MYFEDRREAGRLLAQAVSERVHDPGAVVLGLSFGGIVVAREVAGALGIGADAFLAPPPGSRHDHVRVHRAPLCGHSVILVDDGAATGRTVFAALDAVRRATPSRVIVALPVAPASTCTEIEARVDELVCLYRPHEFLAVAACYGVFPRLTPGEALRCLDAVSLDGASRKRAQGICPAVPLSVRTRDACDRLDRGLREIEAAVAANRMEHAVAKLEAWRQELVRHLTWEESELLPAYAEVCGTERPEAVEEHLRLHCSMLELAADLAGALARPSAITYGDALCLVRALERKLAMHRDRELYGLCALLDSTGPRLTL